MGLDELVGDNSPITSRRKVENHNLSKHNWKWLILHHSEEVTYICDTRDANEVKMWISLIDDILENGVAGVSIGESEEQDREHYREELKKHL